MCENCRFKRIGRLSTAIASDAITGSNFFAGIGDRDSASTMELLDGVVPEAETVGIEPTQTDIAMMQALPEVQNNNKQVNIDNADVPQYNILNGGDRYGGTDQLHGIVGEGVRTRPDGGRIDRGISVRSETNRRGNLSLPGVVLLNPKSQQILKQRGIVNIELHESSDDNAVFSFALQQARTADAANGWAVTPKDAVENYMRDGKSREEAEKSAFLDAVKGVGWASAGGFLMGEITGGTSSVSAGHKAQRAGTKIKAKGNKMVDAIIQDGLAAKEGSEARRLAEESAAMVAEGKEIPSMMVGAMYRANVQAQHNGDIAYAVDYSGYGSETTSGDPGEMNGIEPTGAQEEGAEGVEGGV